MDDRIARIRALNDQLRQTFTGGRIMMTAGIQALAEADKLAICRLIQTFAAFTPANDPNGEHDFGSITAAGHSVFWKIDYYDLDLQFGSPDPSDQSVTRRVLTIMLASEY